jgi:hypothetical protein
MSRDSANFETEGDNRVIIAPCSNTCCSFVALSSTGSGELVILIKGLRYFLTIDNIRALLVFGNTVLLKGVDPEHKQNSCYPNRSNDAIVIETPSDNFIIPRLMFEHVARGLTPWATFQSCPGELKP